MKIIFLIVLSLMFYIDIFCQDNYPKDPIRDAIINKSEYVFEGKIIMHSTYMRGNPVESIIVRITKVFKGNLSIGTVEILRYVHSFFYETPEEGLKMRTNTQDSVELKKYINPDGIFFCRTAKEFPYDPKYNIDQTDNKIILTYYYNNKYNIGYYGDRIVRTPEQGYTGIGVLKHGRIKTKAEIYQILRRYPNLNIPDTCEPEPGAEADKYSRYGPNATFKSWEAEKAYFDSVRYAHALKKSQQSYLKKDSLKNENTK